MVLKKALLLLPLIFSFFCCLAQNEITDTSRVLEEVFVQAFEQNKPIRSSTASVYILTIANSDKYNNASLVQGFNTVPGVRMEERSPGSYRVNIRGSSLRAPFGVRNLRVIWNDIPVTDAGGNTYFNQFDWNTIGSAEIFKGPAGSMYGAGTGGLLLLNSIHNWAPGVSLDYSTGSYDLQHIMASARFGQRENMNQFTVAHNSNDGYRTQSRFRRDNFSWVSKLKLSDRQQFSASLLVSDLYYQTPGALTLDEFKTNPRAARPAMGGLPSAVSANAAIDQLNFLAGFVHTYKINQAIVNQTSFYGMMAQVSNPTFRNYERRTEPGFGARSIFTFSAEGEQVKWKWTAGGEFHHGFFNVLVFNNRGGKPDTMQTNDDVLYSTNNYFIQGDAAINEKWFFNAGLSLNNAKVSFTRLSRFPVVTQFRTYKSEMAPRFVAKRLFENNLSVQASVSRGFSPPTMAELLPSTGNVSYWLDAEYGWNYELGIQKPFFRNHLHMEITGFYFALNKALVQRRDSSGADYFINAGRTKQKGIEVMLDYKGNGGKRLVDYYTAQLGFTYNHFRYGSFVRGTTDFSGKTLPSVPASTISLLTGIHFKKGWYLNLSFYSAGKIFLNDANTANANAYHLLGTRFGWKKIMNKKFKLGVYAGADNILDEIYSLGNDINAAAGRFYNAAPRRNYYVGFSFQWLSRDD